MRTSSTEWVFTSPIDFKEADVRKVHETSFHVLPSPYITPVAIRALFDCSAGRRSLELKYLSTEPSAKGTYSDDAEIEFGRKTLRPRLITVQLDESASVTQFISKVDRALDSFLRVHLTNERADLAASIRLRDTLTYIRALMRKYQAQLAGPPTVED